MNKDGGARRKVSEDRRKWLDTRQAEYAAPEKADKELDKLVRDACSVVPVPKSEYRRRLLAWRDKHTGAAKYEVLEDLLEWHDKWLEMHDKPFNWFGAVKAMLVMKEPAAPFNTLEDGAKDV